MDSGILGMPLLGGNLQPVAPNASREEQIAYINDIINRLNASLKTSFASDNENRRYMNGYQEGGFPDGSFGMKISKPGYDVNTATYEELLFYWDYTTNKQYWNDPATNKTYMTIGSDGVKIAKPGFDVLTADNADLVFNSNQNVFKIVHTDSINVASIPATSLGNFNIQTFSVTTPLKSTKPTTFDAYVIVGVNTAWKMPYYNTNAATVGNPGGTITTEYAAYTSVDGGGNVVFNVAVRNFGQFPSVAYTVKFYIFQETAN